MNILITCIGSAPQSAISRTLKKDNYNLIGIDIQKFCVGNFICDTFITCPRVSEDKYKNFIENILKKHKIDCVFVGYAELLFFSKNKNYLESNFKCRIFVNDEQFINISNNKKLTYDFCKKNNINVPDIKQITERPIILKPIEGCGSQGIKIIKDNTENDISVDDNLSLIHI